jgi:hypothetical protein
LASLDPLFTQKAGVYMNLHTQLASLALGLLLCSAIVSAGEIYKRVDKDGNVHYSDAPHDGAEKIEVQPITTVPAFRAPAGTSQTEYQPTATASKMTVTISSPANDSAFHDAQGNISVKVKVQPELFDNLLVIKLDGKEVSKGQETSTLLKNLDRGTHQLSAEVVDKSGKVISSDRSSFTLHKPVVKKSAP